MPSLDSMRIIGGAELPALLGWVEGRGTRFLDDPLAVEMAIRLKPNERLVLRAKAIAKGTKPDEFDAKVPPPAPKLVEATAASPPAPRAKPMWAWRKHAITLHELQKMTFDPIRYLVPGVIPEGLALLVGKPKIGKSWFGLDLGIATSGDRYTLGQIKPAQGDVLYLALEDSRRRLQRRADKLLPTFGAEWPERMTVLTEWPRIDQGGLEVIEDWCRSVSKPTLVVVDTLQMIRAAIGKTNLYEADCLALRGLQQLAARWPGLTILVSHHDRKMGADDVFDTVAGTRGITGTADTVLILARQAGAVTLHVDGRDVEKADLAIQFSKDTCRWTLLGIAAEVHRSAERARVLTTLEEAAGELAPKEIWLAMDRQGSLDALYVLLFRMLRDGEIEKVGHGKYRIPGKACKDERVRGQAADIPSGNDNLTDLTDLTADRPEPSPEPSLDFPDLDPKLDRRPVRSVPPADQPALGPPGDSMDDFK